MATIDVSLNSLFFFMVGFVTALLLIILLAVFWVVFPRISEAKKFFDFWLKIRKTNKDQTKLE